MLKLQLAVNFSRSRQHVLNVTKNKVIDVSLLCAAAFRSQLNPKIHDDFLNNSRINSMS